MKTRRVPDAADRIRGKFAWFSQNPLLALYNLPALMPLDNMR